MPATAMLPALLLAMLVPACRGVEPVIVAIPGPDAAGSVVVPGAMWPAAELVIPFRIESAAAEPLTVRSEITGCRCALAAGGEGRIAPGAALAGTMSLHSAAWHGTLGATLAVTYAAAGAEPRTRTLRVQVEVADLLANSADAAGAFRVADVEQGDAGAARDFTVERGGYPLAFAAVEVEPDPSGRLRLAIAPLAVGGWRVDVSGLGNLPIGSLSLPVRFRFRTAAGELLERVVERRLCLRVLGAVRPVPREVLFGELDARAAPVSAAVDFRPADGVAMVAVRGWEVDHPGQVGIVAAGPGRAVLRFHDFAGLPGEDLDASVRGAARFRVAVGGREVEVSVPYVAIVRRRSLVHVPAPGP